MKPQDQYSPVKNYIEYKIQADELYLDEQQMEDILSLAIKQDGYNSNKGINTSRLPHNPREQAFHDQWLKENIPQAGINHGHGILQDLFIDRIDTFNVKWAHEITNRERMIVATVIQWLGSNVGICFLESALKCFGAKIEWPPYKPENKQP